MSSMTAENFMALGLRVTGRRLRAVVALSVGVCSLLPPAAARAQSAADSATAQALFDRGKALMKSGNYSEACPVLEESQHIEARSGTLLNLADCYEREGRLASAWSTFVDAATLSKASGNEARERTAKERAATLVPRLSKLVIKAPNAASTPGLEITRDGTSIGAAQLGVPLPVDAGTHLVAAKAPGRKPWQSQVTVQGAASTTNVAVPDLEPAPPAPATVAPAAAQPKAQSDAPPSASPAEERAAPSRMTTGVIVSGSATVAFGIGTVVTSVLYGNKLHDYNQANEQLAPNRSDLHSQTETLGAVNLALLGATVVTAGITVFLFARGPSKPTSASSRLELHGSIGRGMSGLTLEGTL